MATYSTVFYTIKDLNNLSQELRSFMNEIEKENHYMQSETSSVHSYWQDDQYNKFAKYMGDLAEDIRECEQALNKSCNELEAFISALLRDA